MGVLRFRKKATEEMGKLMAAFSPAAAEDPVTAPLAADAKRLAEVIDNPEASITNNELRTCFIRAASALRDRNIPPDRREVANMVLQAGLAYKTGLPDANIFSAIIRTMEIQHALEDWSKYAPAQEMPPAMTEKEGGNDEAEIILGTEKNSRKARLYALLDIGALMVDEKNQVFRLTPIGSALCETLHRNDGAHPVLAPGKPHDRRPGRPR